MSEITIKPEDLEKTLEGEAKRSRDGLDLAARAAALKLVAYLVQLTDSLGITYLGTIKQSFFADGTTVSNSAPHFPFVDQGTRPHPVSEEGQQAIKTWCMRKLGLDEKEAERATFLICRKIAAEGTAPRYLMRDSLEKANEFYKQEVERIFKKLTG